MKLKFLIGTIFMYLGLALNSLRSYIEEKVSPCILFTEAVANLLKDEKLSVQERLALLRWTDQNLLAFKKDFLEAVISLKILEPTEDFDSAIDTLRGAFKQMPGEVHNAILHRISSILLQKQDKELGTIEADTIIQLQYFHYKQSR